MAPRSKKVEPKVFVESPGDPVRAKAAMDELRTKFYYRALDWSEGVDLLNPPKPGERPKQAKKQGEETL